MEVPMNFCLKKKSQSVLTGNDQDTFWGFFFLLSGLFFFPQCIPANSALLAVSCTVNFFFLKPPDFVTGSAGNFSVM